MLGFCRRCPGHPIGRTGVTRSGTSDYSTLTAQVPTDATVVVSAAFMTALAPLAVAGVCIIYSGLGRTRSAAHTLFVAISAAAVGAISYWAVGASIEGLSAAGIGSNRWIALSPLFSRGITFDGSLASLNLSFKLMAVVMAVVIPIGALMERWRTRACCVSAAVTAGFIFPIYSHWISPVGWLGKVSWPGHAARGVIDVGGSGYIHALGGLIGLSLVWQLGARRGKYGLEGIPAALPGHNTVIVLFGCVLALVGWFGLNGAGALLRGGMTPLALPLVLVNTLLAPASAAGVTALITRYKFGKPDASLTANGWLGGLVAISAGCTLLAPATAVLIGGITGLLVPYIVDVLESHFAIDDPAGSITTHAVCGIWGLLATGLFAQPHVSQLMGLSSPRGMLFGDSAQLLAQAAAVAALIAFVLPFAYAFHWMLGRAFPLRIPATAERLGADLHELGGSAYPEFITHSEDFGGR
jgi:Amt family ammonium transporter